MKSPKVSKSAAYWIDKLKLSPHPEGGYFREFFRSQINIKAQNLPEYYARDRSGGTAIYYLMDGADFSAFHRLKTDEIWFFHEGGQLNLHFLKNDSLETQSLSREQLVLHVPAGEWFAAEMNDISDFALVSCVVIPGFEYDDLEIGSYEKLKAIFPQHQNLIRRLTHTEGEQSE